MRAKKFYFLFIFIIFFTVCLHSQKLSEKQKIEDFEYLYNTLKNNFPYFGVLKRQFKIDWLSRKEEYLKQIKKTKTDKEFYEKISEIIDDLHNGHSDLFPTQCRKYFLKLYKEATKKYPKYRKWVNVLEKGNDYWVKFAGKCNIAGTGNEKTIYDENSLKLKIVEEGNIAVITIKSFEHYQIEKDKKKLMKYFKKIKNYKNLIIDIQGNGGGDSTYWSKHIVPYLINKPISYKTYIAIKKGKIVQNFYCDDIKDYEKTDINKLKSFMPNLPPEILKGNYYIYSSTDKIEPKGSINFKGKIYLLVDRGVFSSSEGFAVFAKTTKWATVAGTRTSGDGIGTDPVIICLPNSKILIRFPGDMGLNPDGSPNDETATIPDIKIKGSSKNERLFKLIKMINPKIKIARSGIPTPNECFLSKDNKFIFIYPTKEKGHKINSSILKYVNDINKRFFNLPKKLIVPDTIALKNKYKEFSIIVYGTFEGNLWLKNKIKNLPIRISKNQIKAKKIHKGKNLRLIVSWKNPDNDKKCLIIYTAQNPSQIININSVFHGPENYVIANEKGEILEKGDFVFKNGRFVIEE